MRKRRERSTHGRHVGHKTTGELVLARTVPVQVGGPRRLLRHTRLCLLTTGSKTVHCHFSSYGGPSPGLSLT